MYNPTKLRACYGYASKPKVPFWDDYPTVVAMGQNLRYLFSRDYQLFKRLFGCSPGYRGFDPLPKFGCTLGREDLPLARRMCMKKSRSWQPLGVPQVVVLWSKNLHSSKLDPAWLGLGSLMSLLFAACLHRFLQQVLMVWFLALAGGLFFFPRPTTCIIYIYIYIYVFRREEGLLLNGLFLGFRVWPF